jgi:hypothetical protein
MFHDTDIFKAAPSSAHLVTSLFTVSKSEPASVNAVIIVYSKTELWLELICIKLSLL